MEGQLPPWWLPYGQLCKHSETSRQLCGCQGGKPPSERKHCVWLCKQKHTIRTAHCAHQDIDRDAGTQPCNLKLEGADALLTGLSGGVDGKYEVWSCENGRPMYKRAASPKNGTPFVLPS